MVIQLDDTFGAQVRAAAAGVTLSDWARSALAQKAALDAALRVRAEEDARGPLHTDEQEDALMSARAGDRALRRLSRLRRPRPRR